MSDDWWGGGGESGGPTDADMRARGYEWSNAGDGGGWQYTGNLPKAIAGTGSYAGDTWEAGKGYDTGYLPDEFDWQKYINAPSNEDLRRAGIDTKVEAERHYALYGRTENRAGMPDWYNKKLAEEQKIFSSGEIYNPNAGKLLGYIYELPSGERTVNKNSGGKKIPIYEPPFNIDYDAKRALTPTEKFNVVANVAGAADAPVEWGVAKGVLNAGYMSPKLESVFKAPKEIQSFADLDPTKSDWAASQGRINLPQDKKKWYEELVASPVFGLGLMALGLPAGLSNLLGGGIAGAAGAGALLGGAQAAATGGDFFKGALTGGATGGFGAAATPIVGSALQSAANITGLAADVLTKAAVSAGTAALQGGDPLQAALVSAVGTGVGGAVGGLEMLKDLDPAIAKAVTAAASGAARAAVGGGDPVAAALSSVANVVGKSALEALPGSAPSTAAPVTPDPDILSQLGAQEAEAQQLQQLLSDAGITTPEQRGLLAGDYKQEGMGDVLARGAESALGALIPSAQAAGQDRLVLPQPTETDGAQPSDYKYFFDVMSKGDPQSAYAGLAADEKAAVDRAGQEFQASSQDRQLDLLASYRTGQFAPKETPTESWIDRGMLGAEPGASMPDILEMLEQQQAQQQSMQKAVSEYSKPENVQPDILNVLNRKQADTDAAIAALEQATGQKITAGDADILARLAEQGASQSEMEAALRGEIGGMGETFQRNLQQALAQQKASQAETEAALRGEIGGLGQTFDQRVTDLMKQGRDYQSATNQALIEVSRGQEELGGKVAGLETTFDKRLADILAQQGTSQAEMEAALRGQIGGLGTSLEERISKSSEQQQAEQRAMEAALRGEIGGLGTTFDKRLSDILAQQEREQASMQTALSGYDQRIVDLMRQGESEQEAMRRALEESQATTQQQISGVQTGLGQQISGLGKTLGEALSGVTQQFGATTQGLQQQISQAQQQAGMGNLLAMLGLMQQGKQEAPPIPLVGEIKPFEFSTDLLEGIYQPKQTGLLGANDQLLKMTRG